MAWKVLEIESDDVRQRAERDPADHEREHSSTADSSSSGNHDNSDFSAVKHSKANGHNTTKSTAGSDSSQASLSGVGVTLCGAVAICCFLFLLAALGATLYYASNINSLIRNQVLTQLAQLSTASATSTTGSTLIKCDIAVIGAGPGGVWSALRLQRAQPSSKVCLVESQNEVGGRLKTRFFDGLPGIALDLGGMRFYQRQQMVWSLVQQYGLSFYTPLPATSANYDFLRGRVVYPSAWAAGTAPYIFSAAEQAALNATPGSTPNIFSAPIYQATGLSPITARAAWTSCDWNNWSANAVAAYSGGAVWNEGYWYALQQMMSDEAIAAMKDLSGYDSTVAETNLADALHHSLSSHNNTGITYSGEMRLTQGYQQLVTTMWNQFSQAGGTTFLNTQLTSNIPTGDGGVLLSVQGGAMTIQASSVIYALPKDAIQALRQPGQSLSTATSQTAIASVSDVPAFKIFLAFPSAWWTQAGITGGMLRTSMPIRKLYYWAIDSASNDAVILAGYEDSNSATYFEDLLEGYPALTPIYFSAQPNFASSHAFVSINSSDALAVVTREVMREIRVAHPGIQVPDPYASVFQDWGRAPWGAGWHEWNVGAQSQSVRQLLRQPSAEPTYVCGEAYSDDQGWVEGALRSCEKLLIDVYQLPSQWSTYVQCT